MTWSVKSPNVIFFPTTQRFPRAAGLRTLRWLSCCRLMFTFLGLSDIVCRHVLHIPSNFNLFRMHKEPSYWIVRTSENVFSVVNVFDVHVINSHSPTFSSFHPFVKYSFNGTVTATLNCHFVNNFSSFYSVWLTIWSACRSSWLMHFYTYNSSVNVHSYDS